MKIFDGMGKELTNEWAEMERQVEELKNSKKEVETLQTRVAELTEANGKLSEEITHLKARATKRSAKNSPKSR